jgi:hypothetical protein
MANSASPPGRRSETAARDILPVVHAGVALPPQHPVVALAWLAARLLAATGLVVRLFKNYHAT